MLRRHRTLGIASELAAPFSGVGFRDPFHRDAEMERWGDAGILIRRVPKPLNSERQRMLRNSDQVMKLMPTQS